MCIRFDYYDGMEINSKNVSWAGERLDKLINSSLGILDLIELYQISTLIKVIKKQKNKLNYISHFLSRKSEINKKLNKSYYGCTQIINKLTNLNNMEKFYFIKCNKYFWLYLIDFKKMAGDNVLKLMDFCCRKFGGSLLLQNKLCKLFEKQIVDYMLNDDMMLFTFYKRMDQLVNFSDNIYENGKKEQIIEKYLNKSSEKNLNILNFISTDKKISKNLVKNARISKKAKELKTKYCTNFNVNIITSNGTDYIEYGGVAFPFFRNYFSEMKLNDCEEILSQASLLDGLHMCIAPSGIIRSTLSTELLKEEYTGKYYKYDYIKVKDLVCLKFFNLYLEKLKENRISIIDVLNLILRKTLPDKFQIDNFKDVQIENEISLDKINTSLCKFLHTLIKMYDGFAETSDMNLSDLDGLKVPKLEDIKSVITKKYVIINDPTIKSLSRVFNQFSYIFERSDYTLRDYDKINISPLIDKKIIECTKNNEIIISDKGFFNLLYLLNIYDEIPYNEITLNDSRKIIDNLIMQDKAFFKSRLLNTRESNYLSYFIDDKFTNGFGIRNVYMHGSDLNLSEEEHKNNNVRLLYVICVLILKMMEDLKLYISESEN